MGDLDGKAKIFVTRAGLGNFGKKTMGLLAAEAVTFLIGVSIVLDMLILCVECKVGHSS